MATHPYPKNFTSRNANLEDIPTISDLVETIYPDLTYVDTQCYKEHIRQFPLGQYIFLDEDKIISYSSSIRVDEKDINKDTTWYEIVNHVSDFHDKQGNYLYITEMCVNSGYRGHHLATQQLEQKKRLCRKLSLKGILLISRLTHFADKQKEAQVAENYVRMVAEEKIVDKCLLLYMRNGFERLEIINNYLPDDSESLGFGQCFIWRNC